MNDFEAALDRAIATLTTPAFYGTAMMRTYADEMGEPPLVGDEIARLRAFRERTIPDEGNSDRLRHLARRIEVLAAADPDSRLLTLTDALTGDDFDDEQKFCIRWQHRSHLCLDHFEESLMGVLTHADDGQLDRLALAFPIEVSAIRRWRSESGFSDTIRDAPIHFSL